MGVGWYYCKWGWAGKWGRAGITVSGGGPVSGGGLVSGGGAGITVSRGGADKWK